MSLRRGHRFNLVAESNSIIEAAPDDSMPALESSCLGEIQDLKQSQMDMKLNTSYNTKVAVSDNNVGNNVMDCGR